MDVIAAINGQLTSEVAALYGLHFARLHGLPLVLLHVANPGDTIEAVTKSMDNVETVAREYGMATERVILEGDPAEAVLPGDQVPHKRNDSSARNLSLIESLLGFRGRSENLPE